MKFRYIVIFFALLFPVLSAQAQNAFQSSGAAKSLIEYQWPRNGDIYVPQKATFIVRPLKAFMNSHSTKDFAFTVLGQSSGNHPGKVSGSTDNQTIIFEPDQPFALNENVIVTFQITSSENIAPIFYSFHTTEISEQQRGLALFALQQKEQKENDAALQALTASLPTYNDTISFNPAIVTIDTLTDTLATLREGNLFFSPTAQMPSPYSFLAIAADTASKALLNNNSFIFERNIPNGTGNFRMQPDGTLTYFHQFFSPTGGIFDGQIEQLDQKMRIIDTFQCKGGYTADLHDFNLLFNNRAILVAYDPQKVNMKKYLDTVENGKYSSLAQRADTSETVFGAIIQELDENKQQVFLWRSWDHFQIVDAQRDIHLVPSNAQDTLIDYMHINTAIRDPKDANFIASFRHCDEVSKIDSNGNFVWRWGGKNNQFTFLGDTLKFSHQHDPERIANGNITLFDNGNLHTKIIADTVATVPSTRAIEYALDEVNHTATAVWQYNNLPYSPAAGNVQRFDDGNTLIGLGIITQPSAVEITPDKSRIFQMSIQTGAFSYRTYRFPFTPVSSVRQIGPASSFSLVSIYPNPALNSATIAFSVAEPGLMQIDLLDILGHMVRNIKEKVTGAGTFTADLDVHDLPTGTYYCKLSENGNVMMKMLVVQK